jgi:RNA polymerase sigma-70 factor (ECF subfamily)
MNQEPAGGASDPVPETSIRVRGALGGDAASLAWMIERFSPLLLAYAAHRLGPGLRRRIDPEDLVQEAWLISLPALQGLSPRDGRYTPVVLRFLSTTLRHRILKLYEHQRVAREESISLDSGRFDASMTGVVSAAVRSESRRAIVRAVEELSEPDREILLLRGVEGRAHAEIGASLEITPEASAVRYHRALARLRDQLPATVLDELKE